MENHGLTEGRNIVLQFFNKCVRYLLEEIEPPALTRIIYEHEMVFQSTAARVVGIVLFVAHTAITLFFLILFAGVATFLEMTLYLLVGLFYYALIKYYRLRLGGILLVLVPLTIVTMFISPTIATYTVIYFPLIGVTPYLLKLPGYFNNKYKIRLIITDTDLLIRAPKEVSGPYGCIASSIHLRFSLRDIRYVSITNVRDPNLGDIFDEHANIKVLTNEHITWSRHSYQYVFALPNTRHDSQFIDLELRNQRRILIEFDDAQNFLRVFEQRMPGIGKIT